MEQHRVELDPDRNLVGEGDVPPEEPSQRRVDDTDITERINALIDDIGGDSSAFDGKLVRELVRAGLKLVPDGRNTGELKLMSAAMKEMRYAYRVFGEYPEPHKVTIFGSARTKEHDPDYESAVQFSRLMAESGWMVITGAGDGIMKAGHVGPGREASFGVAIRLPFETTANEVIKGDEKLINFRYFFTRKLMFLSQAEAVVNFPGGFGTMDETFETLTLVQTGKASMIPIVMLEHEGGDYWDRWAAFARDTLAERGMISAEDERLFHISKDPRDAVEHVLRFYRVYHSSRYVRDTLVIRLKHSLSDADVEAINDEFAPLVKSGKIELRGPLPEEQDHLDLPRLVFEHTRYRYAMVRALIDRINECEPGAG